MAAGCSPTPLAQIVDYVEATLEGQRVTDQQ